MELQLTTTKKKITRSIILQMELCNFNMEVLRDGNTLGFCRNVKNGKYLHEYIILEHKGLYYKLNTSISLRKHNERKGDGEEFVKYYASGRDFERSFIGQKLPHMDYYTEEQIQKQEKDALDWEFHYKKHSPAHRETYNLPKLQQIYY